MKLKYFCGHYQHTVLEACSKCRWIYSKEIWYNKSSPKSLGKSTSLPPRRRMHSHCVC